MSHLLQYMERESLNIYNKYSNKKFVYLDLKYWILLRDGDQSGNPIAGQIIEKIRQLYDAGKCIFPISDTVYYEVMKQGDDIKRLSSIALIDRYSEGLAMVTAEHQFKITFGYWIRKHLKIENLIEPKKRIWSKINLVIGFPGFAQQFENLSVELHTAYFDFASKIPLQFTHSNSSMFEPFKGKDDINALNEGKEKFKDQNKTFKEMFISELESFIQEFKILINEELSTLFLEKVGRLPTIKELEGVNADDYCKLIIQMFREDKLTNELPLLKIGPALFGLMRWNKDRVYKDGNDTMDVLHAAHALSNCDYFFTEKELRSMIVQLKLDKMFDCIVESDPKRVLDVLNSF